MKKITALILCMTLMMGMLALPGYAAGNDADEMKQVLTIVKGKVTIPAKYTDFEYEIRSQDGQRLWRFCWSGDGTIGALYVSANQDGQISEYRIYQDEGGKRAPILTHDEAQTRADAAVKKMLPEIAAKLKGVPSTLEPGYYSDGNAYHFTYARQENGIPCDGQTVSVWVNYVTGQVETLLSDFKYDLSFTAPKNPIGADKAREIWSKSAGLSLQYAFDYSGVSGTDQPIRAFLQYVPAGEMRPLDAETGEVIPADYEWVEKENKGYYSIGEGAGAGNSASAQDEKLSEEELAGSEELAGLLSVEQADAKVRAFKDLYLDASYTLYNSSLYKEGKPYVEAKQGAMGADYRWEISYSAPVTEGEEPLRARAVINAKTGELLSFSAGSNIDEKKKSLKYNEATTKPIAERFLKQAAPKLFDSTGTPVVTPSTGYYYDEKSGYQEYERYCEFWYGREYLDVPVTGNGLSVMVDYEKGKVTYYSRSWEENVNFEDKAGIITAEAATQEFVKRATPVLGYRLITQYFYDQKATSAKAVAPGYDGVETDCRTILCYQFDSPSAAISAKTGEYIDAAGAVIQEQSKFTGYSDIKGHFAEREITMLADIGVLPQSETFAPNRAILQKELLYYLFQSQNYYRWYEKNRLDDPEFIEELYKLALEHGIVLKNERAPEKTVTRYDAVRMVVRFTKVAGLAKDSSIFRVDFKDAASIPSQYLGYVAIAKSLGIISGSGGYFRGTNTVTRGEAARMSYNFLSIVDESWPL